MLKDYTWLHVEPTTRCNAWCPSCPRNKQGFGLADFVVEDLDVKTLQATINKLPAIKTVQMCGNLGDPCAAKNIDKLLQVIVDNKSITRLLIQTNGSLRKPSWWSSLVEKFSYLNQFDIIFARDGLEDTHSIYRQATNWNTIIKNAQAFIDSGGSAVWQFIPFEHNEHQVMDCMRLSQKLGFSRFEFVRDARYEKENRHWQTGNPIDIKPWKEYSKFSKWAINYKDYVKRSNCMHLELPSVFLSASGVISPCCYMAGTPLNGISINNEFNNKTYRNVCLKSCGSKY